MDDLDAFLKKYHFKWIALGMVLLFVGVCTLNVNNTPSRPLSTDCDEYDAQIAAQKRIEAILKAPSQAKFVLLSAARTSSQHWTVRYQVDAPNSFNAMLRTNYSVDVHCEKGKVFSSTPREF